MEKIKGKVESVEETTAKIRGEDRPKYVITLEGSDRKYSGWGKSPYQKGQEAEIEYTIDKREYDGQEYTFYNIVSKKKGFGNFGDIIKALTIPKIHIGMEQEVVTERVKAGTYDKILTRKVSVNLSINPLEINAEEIDRLKKLARLSLEDEIESINTKDSPEPKGKPPETKEKTKKPIGSEDDVDLDEVFGRKNKEKANYT